MQNNTDVKESLLKLAQKFDRLAEDLAASEKQSEGIKKTAATATSTAYDFELGSIANKVDYNENPFLDFLLS